MKNILARCPNPPSRREFLWSLAGESVVWRWRKCWGQNALLADGESKGRAEFNGGLHHRAKGEARHSAVHERRREPDGLVRLQAGIDEAKWAEV